MERVCQSLGYMYEPGYYCHHPHYTHGEMRYKQVNKLPEKTHSL